MDEQPYDYQGYAQVYLHGKDVLQVGAPVSRERMLYYVGSASSKIEIHDFRKAPAKAAIRALRGRNASLFADFFCQPAWVTVRSDGDSTRIELHETQTTSRHPTLWLGVLEGLGQPVYPSDWSVQRATKENRTAFAALSYYDAYSIKSSPAIRTSAP
jgi:hypothetical protein